jgi:hypothetical protein
MAHNGVARNVYGSSGRPNNNTTLLRYFVCTLLELTLESPPCAPCEHSFFPTERGRINCGCFNARVSHPALHDVELDAVLTRFDRDRVAQRFLA